MARKDILGKKRQERNNHNFNNNDYDCYSNRKLDFWFVEL